MTYNFLTETESEVINQMTKQFIGTMKQKLSIEQTAEKVIEHFDFQKVHKVMKFLNWQWVSANTGDRIPTLGGLMNHARKLLIEVGTKVSSSSDNHYFSSTGGFKAEAQLYPDGEIVLELSFYVAEFNWSTADTCY